MRSAPVRPVQNTRPRCHTWDFPVTVHREIESETIPNCILRKSFGRGGQEEVFQAQATILLRQVAIKLSVGSHPIAEARAACRLYHPNIAQVYEAGTAEDGGLYFVMEYIAGESTSHVRNPIRRLQKRETGFTDARGLVPQSEAWSHTTKIRSIGSSANYAPAQAARREGKPVVSSSSWYLFAG
jgi:serine/threonine protein kinase